MSVPFANTFNNASVFVTGHTGFKGSWLCLWLSRLGAKVTGYALAPPTDPNNFTVSSIRDTLADHHVGDIRNQDKLHSAMKKAQPDVVLHLAAQSVVRRSYQIPYETFDVNAMGTASVLEGVRNLDKPCSVVSVTSDFHPRLHIFPPGVSLRANVKSPLDSQLVHCGDCLLQLAVGAVVERERDGTNVGLPEFLKVHGLLSTSFLPSGVLFGVRKPWRWLRSRDGHVMEGIRRRANWSQSPGRARGFHMSEVSSVTG